MSEENIKSWPPHKYALEQLQQQGYVAYGAAIPMRLLVDLIDMGEPDTWQFRGEYLELSKALKNMGYVPTEAGQEGKGIRILTREEMAEWAKRKEHRKAQDSIRNSSTLSHVPREGLTMEQAKELEHWEQKSALLGASATVLLRRKELPSPEMTVKALRDLA